MFKGLQKGVLQGTQKGLISPSKGLFQGTSGLQAPKFTGADPTLVFSYDAGNTKCYLGSSTSSTELSNNKTSCPLTSCTFDPTRGWGNIVFGASSYILFNDARLPSGSASRTISLWIYPTTVNSAYHIAFFYGTYSSTNMVETGLDPSNKIFFSQHGGGFSSSATMVVNTWVNVILTLTTPSSWVMYINNSLTNGNSGTVTTNTALATHGLLGAEYNGSPGTQWLGGIAVAKVWNRVLSQEERDFMFNTERTRFGI